MQDPFSREVGIRAHRVIGNLAPRGLLEPSAASAIRHETAQVMADSGVPRRPLALRQAVIGLTSVYFRRFRPPVRHWEFVGAEVSHSRGRFDFVWQHRSKGTFLADEVKTGFFGAHTPALDPQTRRQLERHRRGGQKLWGQLFLGVRLVIASAPNRSLWIGADGVERPLAKTEVGFWPYGDEDTF